MSNHLEPEDNAVGNAPGSRSGVSCGSAPSFLTRREVLPLVVGGLGAILNPQHSKAAVLLPDNVKPTPPSERQVGVSYEMWHFNRDWSTGPKRARPWGTPRLGFYQSDDETAIRAHAEWLAASNVDFINIDWSNDLNVDPQQNKGVWQKQFIEESTYKLFDIYSLLPRRPRISIMLGDHQAFETGHTFSALQEKADQIYARLVNNRHCGPLIQTYLGKPLLIVFLGVHVAAIPPQWNDPRFSVRYMSAYIKELGPGYSKGSVSTSGYWSWEERGVPTFTICNGHPEAMTVVASWRPGGSRPPPPGRDGGATFIANWRVAREVGPHFVLAGTFNEWWSAEQISPDLSKDLEPSREFGFKYLDIVRDQAALFKQGL